jgi:phosphocarrier protein HPr
MDASTPLRRTVKIRNQRGLHARAAAKFVQSLEHLDCEVTVSKDGTDVSGRSIMGLMMLAAGPGSELALSATGPDAAAGLAAIAELVQRGFDED